MRTIPLLSADWRMVLRLAAAFVAARALSAQTLPIAPDFSQASIKSAAVEAGDSWTKWLAGDEGLESQVFKLPMSDARSVLGQSLGRFLDYLDKRHAYSEAVLSYMDKRRLQPDPRQPVVTQEEIARDQLALLGVSSAKLEGRLGSLRSSPDWLAIRRKVQPESSQVQTLHAARLSEIPMEVALGTTAAAPPPLPLSSIVYRDSERQATDALQKLWTKYYQALMDAVEQKPAGAAPLAAARASGAAVAAPETAAPAPPATAAGSPLVGVWAYVAGSEQFNGVDEPRSALLELWMEDGALTGRYRAELPDFQGVRSVDIRLHGVPAAGEGRQSLDFESKDPPGSGRIELEGPGASGKELMLVRAVTAQGPIPRGRELLRKR